MNILILSCGTRCKLVQYFKNCKEIEKVICTDVSEEAPALLFADAAYLVPKMKNSNYFDVIFDICRKEDIKAVLPLHEEELLLISKNAELFREEGIVPIISDFSKISLCKDKLLLAGELKASGISTVDTFPAEDFLLSNDDFFAFFAKPRYGAGSINTFKLHNKKMLKDLVEEFQEDFVVQPEIKGKEYGIDVYVDLLSKEVISVFCKEKLRMRAGETEKSISVKNADIERLVKDAVNCIGLVGPVDIDVLEESGKYYILEINPRFGGGYPHAYECGVDFPTLIANNINGVKNKTSETGYKENVLAMKYSEIVTKEIIR